MAHQYNVTASASPESLVTLKVEGLASIESGPPKEFGGSGEQWSPEDLLVSAVADCFVLSFKAVATASKYQWTSLSCSVTGTLDKVDKAMQFTALSIKPSLTVPADADVDRAHKLLEKSEQVCFITNSLKADTELEIEIQVA